MLRKAMMVCARAGVMLGLIRLGRSNQNAYIEPFNGRLRDERLSKRRLSIATRPALR